MLLLGEGLDCRAIESFELTTMSEIRTPEAYHHLEHDEVAKLRDRDLRRGLSAREVKRRRARFGPNEISGKLPVSALKRLLLPFFQTLVEALTGAAFVMLSLGDGGDCAWNNLLDHWIPADLSFLAIGLHRHHECRGLDKGLVFVALGFLAGSHTIEEVLQVVRLTMLLVGGEEAGRLGARVACRPVGRLVFEDLEHRGILADRVENHPAVPPDVFRCLRAP